MTLPFAETVLAWRLARGMTQAQLARAAGIPRPNLSAIERGDREVTLKTLRALAAALDVRPGVLADGCAPNAGAPALTRAALERIAAAAADPRSVVHRSGTPPVDAGVGAGAGSREAALARNLRIAMAARLRVPSRRKGYRRGRGGAEARAYFFLRTTEAPETIATLIERTGERPVLK